MNPTYWPNSERTFCLQVHTSEHSKIAKRLDGARRIAVAVTGNKLEVFEVPRTILWARKHLPSLLPDSSEVWGGDISHFPAFDLEAAKNGENTPSFS